MQKVDKMNDEQPQLLTEAQLKEKEIKEKVAKMLTAEKVNKLKKLNKRVKMIQKKNKLYIRDKHDSARNLAKISQNIFDLVMVKFISEDGEKLYSTINSKVKDWQKLKPINQIIPIEYAKDFEKVSKITGGLNKITVYYNGTWKPLSQISLEVVKDDSKEAEAE